MKSIAFYVQSYQICYGYEKMVSQSQLSLDQKVHGWWLLSI